MAEGGDVGPGAMGTGGDEDLEVFMPEDAEVVADLEGQASDSEEDMDLEEQDMELEGALPVDDVLDCERDDARACLVACEASGSSSKDPEPPKPVYAVKWNPKDPSMAACGCGDDRVRLWKPYHSEGANSITLEGHEDTVVDVDFDATGKLLASGGMDGRVLVWSAITGELLCALEGPGEAVEFVSWHPAGRVLLAGSEDMTLWMWNVAVSGDEAAQGGCKAEGQCMQVFTGHQAGVTCGGFTPNGKLVVSASLDGTARVWNPRTGECQHTFAFEAKPSQEGAGGEAADEGESGNALVSLSFSHDSTMVMCGRVDGGAHVASLAASRVLFDMSEHKDSVESVAFHPSGQPFVATGSLDGSLVVWDANTAAPRVTCAHPGGVIRVQWGDGAFVYTCCLDGRVRRWDARSGQCDREWQGFVKPLLSMDVSPDGGSVVASSDDGTARVFSLAAA